LILTLSCLVDDGLREIEIWGPQTFIPSYRTVYWNVVAIYSKQMYPKHCAMNRKVTGSISDAVIGVFLWGKPSDSAFKRDEYQEYFLGRKAGRLLGLTTC